MSQPSVVGLALLFVGSAIAARSEGTATSLVDHYVLSISRENPLTVHVSAELAAVGDTLFMNTSCPNYDYPEGWSTFVRNLEIRDPSGEARPHRYVSKSLWALDPRIPETIAFEYEVDLSFAHLAWDVGNEQAAYTDEKAIYVVSKALFIVSQRNHASTVTFHLPDDWELAVPWRKGSTHNQFIAPTRDLLVENSLVYGNFFTNSFREGVFDFRLALLGEAGQDGEVLQRTLSTITRAFATMFPGTPPTSYLLTMFYSRMDDGESFDTSIAFTLKNRVAENNKIIWANQMAHELFHYWNSDLMRAQNYADKQWFSEGSAEYYANLTLRRENLISEDEFRSKVEKVLGLYKYYRGWRETETSILDAGENKGLHRFLVYNGGWAVALALDVLIMEHTSGERTLDDLFRLMFERYTTTPYAYEDIVAAASEVTGTDVSPFFEKYVEGTELIPLETILPKLGYTVHDIIYEAEMYLTLDTNGRLRERWLRQ